MTHVKNIPFCLKIITIIVLYLLLSLHEENNNNNKIKHCAIPTQVVPSSV